MPVLIGVVKQQAHRLYLYHRLDRIALLQLNGPQDNLTIRIGSHTSTGAKSPTDAPRSLYTGAPVADVDIRHLDEPIEAQRGREHLRNLLDWWVALDYLNISLMQLHIPVVYTPSSYSTNAIPTQAPKGTQYANPASFGRVVCSARQVFDSLKWYLMVLQTRGPLGTDALSHIGTLLNAIDELRKQAKDVRDKWT